MTSRPRAARTCSTTATRSASVVPACTHSAPASRMRRTFEGAASSGSTRTAGRPHSWAATATAIAWLPVLCATTPGLSAATSRSTASSAPRILNDPPRWRFSAFSHSLAPASRSSSSERTTGVRATRPASRCWALRTPEELSRGELSVSSSAPVSIPVIVSLISCRSPCCSPTGPGRRRRIRRRPATAGSSIGSPAKVRLKRRRPPTGGPGTAAETAARPPGNPVGALGTP